MKQQALTGLIGTIFAVAIVGLGIWWTTGSASKPGEPAGPSDTDFSTSVYQATNIGILNSAKLGNLADKARGVCEFKTEGLSVPEMEDRLDNLAMEGKWPMSITDTHTFVGMAIQTYCPEKTG